MVHKIPTFLKEKERQKENEISKLPTSKTNIYLVLDTKSKKLKIGKSANPKNRLSQLQTANPSELKMLYCIEDVESNLEQELHSLFEAYNVRREWFEYKEEIVEHFKRLSDEK